MKALLFLVAVLVSVGAGAQEQTGADPRIATLAVTPSGYMRLNAAPDASQTLLFRPNERITSVVLSDPNAFFVTVSGAGDSLALRAANASAFGIMSVRTTFTSYEFELIASAAFVTPAVTRLVDRPINQPGTSEPSQAMASANRTRYRLSGSKGLRPTAVIDDGVKTYIQWAPDQALPATFAIGPTGDEQMVDGYMRAGIYTLDRVYEILIFRIDKSSAKAVRPLQVPNHG